MADRMRVTSLIRGTERDAGPGGPLPRRPLVRVAESLPSPRVQPVDAPDPFRIDDLLDEFTSRLATSPALLRHLARQRAVGGPAHERRRTPASAARGRPVTARSTLRSTMH